MKATDLATIKERAEKGVQWTPEECDIRGDNDRYFVPECACLGDTIIQLTHYEGYQDDWVFCAHARVDMRLLLTEVELLREIVSKVAEDDPMEMRGPENTEERCHYCDCDYVVINSNGNKQCHHTPDCPYRMAVEYAEANGGTND